MRNVLLSLLFAVLAVVACQIPDGRFRPPDNPGDGALAIASVSGDGQSAATGAALDQPFVISVTQDGAPLGGAMVHFEVVSGDGSMSEVLVSTDAGGQAASTLTVGLKPGQNTVEAQLVGSGVAPVVFHATGQPGSAAEIKLLSGNNQSLRFGVKAAPLIVQVVDKDGNPVGDFTVGLRVTAGGGVLTDAMAVTDADGRVEIEWFVGGAGTNTIEVTADRLTGSPVVFSASVSAFASTAQIFSTGASTQGLAAADLSGDGKPDLAVVDTGAIIALRNTTPQGSQTITLSSTSQAMFSTTIGEAIADLNGDGKLDIAAVYVNVATISTLVNATAGSTLSFNMRTDTTTMFTNSLPGVVAADINGDDKPDLITFDPSINSLFVALNSTASAAATVSLRTQVRFADICGFRNGSAQDLASTDVNGDGNPDVLVTCGADDNSNSSKGTVVVLLNTTAAGSTTPSLAAPQSFGSTHFAVKAIATGDLNGDGKPDIVVSNNENALASVSVLLNQTATGATTAAFSPIVDFQVGQRPVAVTVADLNGDGHPDIATANQTSASLSVLANLTAMGSATPRFGTHLDLPLASAQKAVAAADLNGDGEPDLIGADKTSLSVILGQ